jgi:hypothetical protein
MSPAADVTNPDSQGYSAGPFAFRYPKGWEVKFNGADDDGDLMVIVRQPNDPEALVIVKYLATGGLCGSLIQTLQGRIIAKTTGSGGSFEQEDSSSSDVRAGRVWTTNFRDLHDKNHILVHSTICAN